MQSLKVCIAVSLLMPFTAVAGMSELSEREMGGVVAQDGIAFEWDLRINADEEGMPLPGLSNVEKRLALKLAGRDALGGEWLVWKGFSGRIYFPTFNLDAENLPFFASPFADTDRFVTATGFRADPYGAQAAVLSYPEVIELWNVKIGGMSLEYGDVPATVDPANPPDVGFLADPGDSRSFIGLAIGNSFAGQPGTLSIEGQLSISAF